MITPVGRQNLPKELIQFGKHLVYSEGTKTEPYYVEGIRNLIATKYHLNLNDIEMICVNKEKVSYNTVSLVKYAKKDLKKRLEAGQTVNHVWIFYDKDDFPMENFTLANTLINKLNNSKDTNLEGFHYNKQTKISFHSCYSNECFELWLILYYKDLETSLNRNKYKRILESSKPLKEIHYYYHKNQENIHKFFVEHGGNIDKAISRAKNLCHKNGLNNPSTSVYLFAEYFKNYLD